MSTAVFLWILRNFYKHLFLMTPLVAASVLLYLRWNWLLLITIRKRFFERRFKNVFMNISPRVTWLSAFAALMFLYLEWNLNVWEKVKRCCGKKRKPIVISIFSKYVSAVMQKQIMFHWLWGTTLVDELCISNEDIDIFRVTVSGLSLKMLERYVFRQLMK